MFLNKQANWGRSLHERRKPREMGTYVVPTPFFGSRLRRQNFNRAPRQYRPLRRLLVNGRDKYERWYLINANLVSMSLLNKWKKITRNKVDRTLCMSSGYFYTWREIFSLRKQPFLPALRRGEERGETVVFAGKEIFNYFVQDCRSESPQLTLNP